MDGDSLQDRVRRAITAHRLFPRNSRLIVGVSGGADSVALLDLLRQLQAGWRLHLHVAHFDHGLRRDSAEDAAFVHALSQRWNLGVTVERCEVARACEREGWSLEDGARRLRYDFFLRVARQQSAGHIVLAHTADDQAETVLMRLVRGTGLMGLGGIPIKRRMEECWIVRPLLEHWRREILIHLNDAHLTYREDATNQDRRFVRNRIRHELLPVLERDYNPNIKAALTQLAEQSHWDYAYLEDAAARQWKRIVKASAGRSVSIAVQPFLRQPRALQRQLIRAAIQRVRGDVGRLEFRHWLAAEQVFLERAGSRLDLPGGVQLFRETEDVVCRLAASSPEIHRASPERAIASPVASTAGVGV